MLKNSRLFNVIIFLFPLAFGATATKQMNDASLDMNQDMVRKVDLIIEQITGLLQAVSANQQPELYFRLAESYFEKTKLVYQAEYELFENELQKWIAQDRNGKEPVINAFVSESKLLLAKSLEIYRFIIDNFKKYRRLDEVYYMLAFSQYELGEQLEGIKNYLYLTKFYPDSIYMADINVALADYYFSKHKLNDAYVYYAKAIKSSKTSNRDNVEVYALFKQAWCDINEQRYPSALVKLKQVISLANTASSRQMQLKEEALNDLVLVFADLSEVNSAYNYFTVQAVPAKAVKLMEKLAKVFIRQGKNEAALSVYKLLLTTNIDAEKKISYNLLIFKVYTELADNKSTVDLINILVNLCQSDASKQCKEVAEQIRNSGQKYHNQAKKTKLKIDLDLAKSLYLAYLRISSDKDELDKIYFYLAELFWEAGELEDSLKYYQSVYNFSPESQFARKALVNTVLTLEKIIQEAEFLILPEQDRQKMKLKFVETVDFYANFFANKKNSTIEIIEIPRLHYQAFLIELEQMLYEKAVFRMKVLLTNYPESVYASKAGLYYMNNLEQEKKWAELVSFADGIATLPSVIVDSALMAQINKFAYGAKFNLINDDYDDAVKIKNKSAKQSKLQKVAEAFQTIYISAAEAEFKFKALYNASIIYRQIGNDILSAKLAADSLPFYQQSHFRSNEIKQMEQKLLLFLGKFYEQTINLSAAISVNEQFVEMFPDTDFAKDLLYNAARFQTILHNYQAASILFEKYLMKYADENEFSEVNSQLAMIYESINNWPAAIKYYKKLAKSLNQSGANSISADLHLAKIYKKTQVKNSLQEVCSKIKSYHKSAFIGDNLLVFQEANAFCAYELLEEEWDRYRKINLQLPLVKLKSKLDDKKNLMGILLEKYLNVIEWGNAEWGTQSLYRAAQVQLEYVKMLRSLPKPKGLNSSAFAIFEAEVGSMAMAVEEDAVAALEKTLSKAFELGIYYKSTREIAALLNKINATSKDYPTQLNLYLNAQLVKNEAAFVKQIDSEIADLKQELANDKSNLVVLQKLANLYFLNQQQGLSSWIADQILKVEPNRLEALNLKGLIHLVKKEFVLAQNFLSKSLALNHNQIDPLLNLGTLAYFFGDEQKAKINYSQALKLDASISRQLDLSKLGLSEEGVS